MSEYRELIEIYGKSVGDFNVSPFESIDMLHVRSKLASIFHELTSEEKTKLLSYDLILIKNSLKMSEHIGNVYDFSMSKESDSFWWWHLDKVAKGELSFNLHVENMVI